MNRAFVLCAAALFLGCGSIDEEPILGAPDSSPSATSADAALSDAGSATTTPDVTVTSVDSAVDSLGMNASDDMGIGDAGTDAASVDATTTGACTPGAAQCFGSDSMQTCGPNGQWISAVACPSTAPFCNGSGLCGACQSGTTQCLFNGVQPCAAGAWGNVVACPSTAPNCAAGVCGQPPSCQVSAMGTTDCGAGGIGTESCCASPEVPGGTYYRTYDPLDPDGGVLLAGDGGAAGEADPATVSEFRLDKYLVTVGRFRQWMNYLTDGGAPPETGSGKHIHLNGGLGLEAPDMLDAGAVVYEPGWGPSLAAGGAGSTNVQATLANNGASLLSCDTDSTWTLSPGNGESLPITCVTWFEAYAFCIWDGGFLPSDAEWGYAAAGGSQQREYPWGSTDPGSGNQYAIYCTNGTTEHCDYPTGDAGGPQAAPVGTPALGEGRWGQLDLAGDVAEWVFDYAQGVVGSPPVNPCTDCASLVWIDQGPNPADPNYSGPFRVSRTGPVETQGELTLLSAYRGYAEQQSRQQRVLGLGGFRCARTP